LKGTQHLKLTLSGSNLELTAYCDADWGSDISDRKSTSGFLVFLGQSLISWVSKKQITVAMSTMEAEFLALSTCIQEVLYLRTLLSELLIPQTNPTLIYQDNQACIVLANTGHATNRSKHIDLRSHFVSDQISNGNIQLIHVPTKDMLADPLTKPVAAITIRSFCENINLR
jgi:hypothetical protein